MKMMKRFFVMFLSVVLLLFSACGLQWQLLCKEDNIAYCSSDASYEDRKGKIKEIFLDYEEEEGYRHYYFSIVTYNEELKEYNDEPDFNCCIYLFGSAKSLKERGWQIQVGDEIDMKGVLARSAGYACFLVAEVWKDDVCYITYDEGKVTILERLKASKNYPY